MYTGGVCRSEEQAAQQREESQQYMRNAAHSRELLTATEKP
jgi:hypothetical protein